MQPSLHLSRSWKIPYLSSRLVRLVSNLIYKRVHPSCSDMSIKDNRPAQYLFRSPPLPSIQTPNLLAAQTSFQRFKGALQNQIACRTPLLDGVVSTLEDGIKHLHDDMDVVCDIRGASRCISFVFELVVSYSCEFSSLVADLSDQFRRDIVLLCDAISRDLTTTVEDSYDSTGRFPPFTSRRLVLH